MISELQYMYRLWYRKDSIIVEDVQNTLSRYWCTRRDFIIKEERPHFPVLKDGPDELAPIAEWPPDKIYRALNSLMIARVMDKVCLESSLSINLFRDYRGALADAVAVITWTPQIGTPQQLSYMKPNWFQITTDLRVRIEEVTSKNAQVDALSKAIQEHHREELEDRRKKMAIMETLTKQNETLTKEYRWREIEVKSKKDKLKRLTGERFRIKRHIHLLKTGGAEDENETNYAPGEELDPDDALTLAGAERDLEDLEETIAKLKLEEEEEERTKNEEQFKDDMNFAITKEVYERDKAVTSMATVNWVKEASLLLDHIMSWQFKAGHSWRLFEKKHLDMKTLIFNDMMRAMKLVAEDAFLLECQKFIVGHSLTFAERESYRMDFSPNTVVSLIDICISRRSVEDSRLEKFPTHLTELLEPEHFYHLASMNYFVHWYISQLLPGVKADSAIFMWDLEVEFLSLDRDDIETPVMALIGHEWIVMRPKCNLQWVKEGVLNGYWCGKSALDALCCWAVLVSKSNYILKDRETKLPHNIKYSNFVRLVYPELFTSLPA